MNMKLIKLLPIAIGAVAIGGGSTSGIVRIVNPQHLQKHSDPFVTWATAAQKDAVKKNIPQLVKIAKISDWKTTDAITIESVKIDIWNESVDVVLAQPALNLSATISDVWVGNSYNINQWWCSVVPRETVANWWWQNWYAGWSHFRNEDIKLQIDVIDRYWKINKVTTGKNSDQIFNDISGDGSFFWNAKIINVIQKGHNTTFRINFYPAFQNYYFWINVVSAYDGVRRSFNMSDVKPTTAIWNYQLL